MRAPPILSFSLCILLIFGICCWLLPADANAAAVSGRLSAHTYLKDDSVDHAMVVPSLSLNVYQLGHRDITFQTTLRGFSDIRNGESANDQVRVQRALLIYRPQGSKWQVRAGQQWINEGVGRGNVAGLWAKYNVSKRVAVTAYGGTRIARTFYFDEEEGDNEAEGANFGAMLRFKVGSFRNLRLSYTTIQKGGDVIYSAAGFDGSCTAIPMTILRARFHMNLEQSAIETAQILAAIDPCDDLQVTLDLRRQTPRVFESSYFARFLEDAGTNHLRGAVRWNVGEDFYVKPSGYLVLADGETLYKVKGGVGCDHIEVGYTHWLSVGDGDMDGFYGQAIGDVTINGKKYLNLFAGFDWAKGSNSEQRANTESQSAYYGLSCNELLSPVTLSAQMQHIRSRTHSEDWRGLFGITWRFSTLRGGN